MIFSLKNNRGTRLLLACYAAGSLAWALAPVHAQPESVCLEFETEMVALSLKGGPFPIPLASDPGNLLGDSVAGYGFVDCEVSISLSSARTPTPGPASLGNALAFSGVGQDEPTGGGCLLEPVDPLALDGRPFFVSSFFDVFFDITVTDVDSRPGRDIAGQPDGASLTLPDNGPAGMRTFYEAIFQKDEPNFGLIPPPESDPYIGHFLIEIPLGGDINGNGENDKIKFTLATHAVGDEQRTFIQLPDGTIVDSFDSAAFLQGAIVDESTDPPFQIGSLGGDGLPDPNSFGGPGSVASVLVNPVIEPDSDGDGIPDADDACPDSDLSPTVVIDGCDTGVDNVLFDSGCTIADLIAELGESVRNHGQFVSGVAHLSNQLKKEEIISGREKGRIQRCAALSSIGK